MAIEFTNRHLDCLRRAFYRQQYFVFIWNALAYKLVLAYQNVVVGTHAYFVPYFQIRQKTPSTHNPLKTLLFTICFFNFTFFVRKYCDIKTLNSNIYLTRSILIYLEIGYHYLQLNSSLEEILFRFQFRICSKYIFQHFFPFSRISVFGITTIIDSWASVDGEIAISG